MRMNGLILLLAAAAAPALAQGNASGSTDRAIVVTGVPLDEARRLLEECIARNCPALEDMAATLRYAEALFLQGNYREARAVLRSSISRNRSAARQYPVGVAGLYRANARMAMHEGDGRDVRQSTYNVERTLRAGLAGNDPRIVGAMLERAEMEAALVQDAANDGYFPLSRFRRAEREFDEAADAARRIGRADLAALADLRKAILAYRIGRPDARRQLEAIAGLTGPETRVQQLGARIVLAGIDRQAGDSSALDALIAELAAAGLRTPALLYAPPVRMANAGTSSGMGSMNGDAVEMRNMSTMASSEGFDYWADVGFWISSEGRVEDVEVLRSHGPQYWMRPVLGSIAGRIYSPPGSGELAYRVERYRFTSLLERRSDRRVLVHSAQGRIEMLDITNSATASTGGQPPAPADPEGG